MKVDIKELIEKMGMEKGFQPGKRIVKTLPQPGQHKSHSVVSDWLNPKQIVISVKAGLKGADIPASELKNYPVSFQSPTFIEIKPEIQARKKKTRKKREDSGDESGDQGMNIQDLHAFSEAADGKVAEFGNIVRMVVMGMEIAKEAFGTVLDAFIEQVEGAKVTATDLLSKAGNFITKYTPPGFLQPTGDETAQYEYNIEKNASMFSGPGFN